MKCLNPRKDLGKERKGKHHGIKRKTFFEIIGLYQGGD